jgi:hypothetical protein
VDRQCWLKGRAVAVAQVVRAALAAPDFWIIGWRVFWI